MSTKKILIHGFYGQGNLGDEAILQALLQEFRKFSGIKVVVLSNNPKNVSAIHHVRSIHSQLRWNFLSRIWHIKSSHLFILGGGGLLKDYGNDSSNVEQWLRLLRHAQILNTKTALCAVGVENIRFDKSKKIIRDTLNKVDLITVRDRGSRDILIELGVTNKIKITTDPAILLNNVEYNNIKELFMPPKIIVCVRHWFDKGFYIEKPELNERFIHSMSITLDFLVEHYNADIDFIPFRTISFDDDRIVAKQIASYMRCKNNVHIHLNIPTADEFIQMAKQSSLIIGMRLHSLILGTLTGTPVIGLEYMPKVGEYMKSIGQEEYCFPLEILNSDKLIQSIKDTFKQYKLRSYRIISEVSKLQNIAKNSFREILKLVKIK